MSREPELAAMRIALPVIKPSEQLGDQMGVKVGVKFVDHGQSAVVQHTLDEGIQFDEPARPHGFLGEDDIGVQPDMLKTQRPGSRGCPAKACISSSPAKVQPAELAVEALMIHRVLRIEIDRLRQSDAWFLFSPKMFV